MESHRLARCALGVYKDGQIVYKHGYGMANLNDDVTIAPENRLPRRLYVQAVHRRLHLLLQQQGKLSIDDDVHKYIPELQDFGVPVTLRQMMHHTSGMRDQWALLELAGWRYSQDLITDDDVMSVLVHQKALNFKPGEKYMYSNTGFTLLAIVVKRVSGMSSVNSPRKISSTARHDPHSLPRRPRRSHQARRPRYEHDDKTGAFRMSLTNFDTAGATSLHTTVEDLQLWDENFYHPKVGGPGFIDLMLHRDKLNNGELQTYASGLAIGTYKGLPTVGHGGADAGYRSSITRFPDQHVGFSVLCNAAEANPGGLINQVADILLAKDLKSPAAAPAKNPRKPRRSRSPRINSPPLPASTGTAKTTTSPTSR